MTPFDTDIEYGPSSKGHANLGHYPDYGWLTIEYPAAWRVNPSNIIRNNPEQFKEAWNEMASVIALCLNKQSNISMPDNVAKDITMRFNLSRIFISAPIKCEENWAANSAKSIANVERWKDNVSDPSIGVTHGLAETPQRNIWIENGSILHMYELASLMHFSWCKRWAKNNPEYGWVPSSPEQNMVAVSRWYSPADKDWISITENEISDEQMNSWGYINKTFQFYASTKRSK